MSHGIGEAIVGAHRCVPWFEFRSVLIRRRGSATCVHSGPGTQRCAPTTEGRSDTVVSTPVRRLGFGAGGFGAAEFLDAVRERLERPVPLADPEIGYGAVDRRGPLHAVADHVQHVLVVVGRVGLVAGAEVEDLAAAAEVAAAAAENLAAGEPTHEDQLVRLRDVEEL